MGVVVVGQGWLINISQGPPAGCFLLNIIHPRPHGNTTTGTYTTTTTNTTTTTLQQLPIFECFEQISFKYWYNKILLKLKPSPLSPRPLSYHILTYLLSYPLQLSKITIKQRGCALLKFYTNHIKFNNNSSLTILNWLLRILRTSRFCDSLKTLTNKKKIITPNAIYNLTKTRL